MVCHRCGISATIPVPVKPATYLPQVDPYPCYTLTTTTTTTTTTTVATTMAIATAMTQATTPAISTSMTIAVTTTTGAQDADAS